MVSRKALMPDSSDPPRTDLVGLDKDGKKCRAAASRKLADQWESGDEAFLPVFYHVRKDASLDIQRDRTWALSELSRIEKALKEMAALSDLNPSIRAPGLFSLLSGAIEAVLVANGLPYETSADGMILPRDRAVRGGPVTTEDMALQLAAGGLARKTRRFSHALGHRDGKQLNDLVHRAVKAARRYRRQVIALQGKQERVLRRGIRLLIAINTILLALALIFILLYFKTRVLNVGDPAAVLKKPPGKPGGIIGQYYRNKYFEGKPKTRMDRTIHFYWRNKSPLKGIPNDRFSIRWKGFLRIPHKGNYTICTRSDDGVRLAIGSKEIVNNWNIHSDARDCKTIFFGQPGWYPLHLRYFDEDRGAIMQLSWAQKGRKPTRISPRSLCCSNH